VVNRGPCIERGFQEEEDEEEEEEEEGWEREVVEGAKGSRGAEGREEKDGLSLLFLSLPTLNIEEDMRVDEEEEEEDEEEEGKVVEVEGSGGKERESLPVEDEDGKDDAVDPPPQLVLLPLPLLLLLLWSLPLPLLLLLLLLLLLAFMKLKPPKGLLVLGDSAPVDAAAGERWPPPTAPWPPEKRREALMILRAFRTLCIVCVKGWGWGEYVMRGWVGESNGGDRTSVSSTEHGHNLLGERWDILRTF
jgi:hypothetical protein